MAKLNPFVRLCAGRPTRSKDSEPRKRRKSTLSETAKRAKKKDEKEKAEKSQQQADANAAQATFVASMAQLIHSRRRLGTRLGTRLIAGVCFLVACAALHGRHCGVCSAAHAMAHASGSWAWRVLALAWQVPVLPSLPELLNFATVRVN